MVADSVYSLVHHAAACFADVHRVGFVARGHEANPQCLCADVAGGHAGVGPTA